MLLDRLSWEIRLAWRRLVGNKGFSLVAILSIALAVGACSTIFSAVNAILWQWLPVPEAHNVVTVSHTDAYGQDSRAMSYQDYLDYGARAHSLSGLAAYSVINVVVGSGERADYVAGVLGTGNLFAVLAAPPVVGRMLSPADDNASTGSVAVISERLWKTRFGGRPDVIGAPIRLNGVMFTVVGVARTDLRPIVGIVVDVWTPLAMQPQLDPGANKLPDRGTSFLNVIGRLRAGAKIESARADLAAAAVSIERTYPSPQHSEPRHVRVDPATLLPVGARAGATLVAAFLALATGLTLSLACVNLANLLLARATHRRRELAVRLALGATRRLIVIQLLTESMLLAVLGGVGGLAFAYVASRALVTMIPQTATPLAVDLTPDGRILVLTLFLSIATGIAFGAWPAIRASDIALTDALSDATAGGGRSRPQRRRRDRLVAVQVALAALLLVIAGLCVRSLEAAQAIDVGFTRRNVLLGSLDPRLRGYSEERGSAFYAELVRRVGSIPGVEGAAVSQVVSLGPNTQATVFHVMRAAAGVADFNVIGPHYFSTLGLPLRAGREFNEEDGAARPKVVIVNEALARAVWPHESAIGKRLELTSDGPELEVVGVAADGKYRSLGEESRDFIYLPLYQNYHSEMTLLVATRGAPRAYVGMVRSVVGSIDPDIALHHVKTLAEHLQLSQLPTKIIAMLLGSLGIVTLALAVVGVYGVASYNTAQRTQEVGVRLAIGASPAMVKWLLVREGMYPVTIGLSVGLLLAAGVARMMSAMLFATSTADAVSFVGVAALLLAVGAVSCLVPAARAAHISIVTALRPE